MKKLSGILTFLLAIPIALAQGTDVSEGIGRVLYDVFGYVFVDLSKLGIGDTFFEFIMRFLLFIALFAILFFAMKFVFKGDKRIQITTAFVIALISIIMIPANVLEWIIKGYEIFAALFLLAFPIIGMIYLIHKVFGSPERHNYAIKAILYYMLAMLIFNIANIGPAYGFPNFDNWIGFASGICMIMMIWNIIRAMFPPGGGESGSPEGSFWDKDKGPEGRDALKGSDADRKAREEEEAATRKAETEAAKTRKDEEDTSKLVRDTLDREEDAKREIDRLKDYHDKLDDAARKILGDEERELKDLRDLLTYLKKLKEGIETAVEKLKEVDEQLKKGDTVKLREYRKELVDYINKGLNLINSKFPLLAEKILNEYNRVLEEKKLSNEEIKALEDMIKEWEALEKYGKLSRKGIGFLGALQRRWMGYWQRISRLHEGGKKRFKEMGAYKNRISKLIEKIRGIYKELEELKAKLRKIVNYLMTFTEKDMKRIREQEKLGKENEKLVEEIKELIGEIVKNPTKSKLTELNKKLKKLYDNSAISLEDVMDEDRVRKMMDEVDIEWKKLEHLEKELERYKRMSVEELMGEIEKAEGGGEEKRDAYGKRVYPEGEEEKRKWWQWKKKGKEGAYPDGTYPKGGRAEEVTYGDKEKGFLGRIAKGIADILKGVQQILSNAAKWKKSASTKDLLSRCVGLQKEAKEVYDAYAAGEKGDERIRKLLGDFALFMEEVNQVLGDAAEGVKSGPIPKLFSRFTELLKRADEVGLLVPLQGLGPTGAYDAYGVDVRAIVEGFRSGVKFVKAETTQELAVVEQDVQKRAEEVQKKTPGAFRRFLRGVRNKLQSLLKAILGLYRNRIKGLYTRTKARLKAAWKRRRGEAKKEGADKEVIAEIDEAYETEQKQLETTYHAALAEYGSMEAYAAEKGIVVNEILVEEDLFTNLNKYSAILQQTTGEPLEAKEIIRKIIEEIRTLDDLEGKKIKEEQPESMSKAKGYILRQEVANLKILRLQLTQALKKDNSKQIRQRYLEQAINVLGNLINMNK